MGERKGGTGFEWVLFLIGIPTSYFGYRLLQVEPITNWFENLINPIVQICGAVSLLIGASLILSPVIVRLGFRLYDSSPATLSYDPSAGIYYPPASQDTPEELED